MITSLTILCFALLMPQLAMGFMSTSPQSTTGSRNTRQVLSPTETMSPNYSSATFLKSAQESLSNDEISRYSRHLVLGDVGMKGQTALKNASVLVIGAGGLGSPCLMYLAAAGVGHIGIVVSAPHDILVDEFHFHSSIMRSQFYGSLNHYFILILCTTLLIFSRPRHSKWTNLKQGCRCS